MWYYNDCLINTSAYTNLHAFYLKLPPQYSGLHVCIIYVYLGWA